MSARPIFEQRGDHVRSFGVIGVAGSVEVGEYEMDRVQAVLLLVSFSLNGQHLLGQAVIDDTGVAGTTPEIFSFSGGLFEATPIVMRADVDNLARLRQRAASSGWRP